MVVEIKSDDERKRYLIGGENDFLGIGFFTGFSKKHKMPTFSSSIFGETRIYKTFSGAERAMKRILERNPKSECFIVPEEMARIYRQGVIREAKEKAQHSEEN